MLKTKHEKNGLGHKTNGPAYVWEDGYKIWYLNGRWHRYYGPTRECIWYIHNQWIKLGE